MRNAATHERKALVRHSGSIAAAQLVVIELAAFGEYRRGHLKVLTVRETEPRSAFVELAAFHERDCRILPLPLRLLECVLSGSNRSRLLSLHGECTQRPLARNGRAQRGTAAVAEPHGAMLLWQPAARCAANVRGAYTDMRTPNDVNRHSGMLVLLDTTLSHICDTTPPTPILISVGPKPPVYAQSFASHPPVAPHTHTSAARGNANSAVGFARREAMGYS